MRKKLVDICHGSVFVVRIGNGNTRAKVTKSDSQAGCREDEKEQQFFHSLRELQERISRPMLPAGTVIGWIEFAASSM